MNKMKSLNGILIVSSVVFCSAFCSLGTTQYPERTDWLNIEYARCLENKLPCDCERECSGYFVVTIDTNVHRISYGAAGMQHNRMEFEEWKIEKQDDNTYVVNEQFEDSTSFVGVIQVEADKLCFKNKEGATSYFKNYRESQAHEGLNYLKQNVLLLNKALTKRQYLTLENMLNSRSLICSCNKELGLNVLTDELTKHSWILAKNNGEVVVYDLIYGFPSKSVPIQLDKKLLYKYKW